MLLDQVCIHSFTPAFIKKECTELKNVGQAFMIDLGNAVKKQLVQKNETKSLRR